MNKAISFLFLFCFSILSSSGQLIVSLEPTKKQYASGEAMNMKLTISNNTGSPVELSGKGNIPWLDLHVSHVQTNGELPQTRFANFPKVNIPSGKSVSRIIDLRFFYDLSHDGYYKAVAVIRPPDLRNLYSSGDALFSVLSGMPIWSQSIKTRNGDRRKYAVCGIVENKKQKIFIQVKDGDTGGPINTVGAGEWLTFFKPQIKIDSLSNLHVLFLKTPTIYCRTTVSPDGARSALVYYQRMAGTQPTLVYGSNGTVDVQGGIPFNPFAKPDKSIRDATQIPR